MIATYIQYGIPSDWANEFQQKKNSATTFKNTSKQNLLEKYGIDKQKIDFVKLCLTIAKPRTVRHKLKQHEQK